MAGRPRRCARGPREPGPAGRRPSAAHRPVLPGHSPRSRCPFAFPIRRKVGLGPALQPRHADDQGERREGGEEDEPEHCHHTFGPSGPSPEPRLDGCPSVLHGPPPRLRAQRRGGQTAAGGLIGVCSAGRAEDRVFPPMIDATLLVGSSADLDSQVLCISRSSEIADGFRARRHHEARMRTCPRRVRPSAASAVGVNLVRADQDGQDPV